MNKPTAHVLPLRAAYAFAEKHGLKDEIRKIREADSIGYTSKGGAVPPETVRRTMIARLFKNHGLLNRFIEEDWDFGSTPAGVRTTNWYLGMKLKRK